MSEHEAAADREEHVGREWDLEGMVQGAGVRPALLRTASRLGLSGRISNTNSGVRIRLEGTACRLIEFARTFSTGLPSQVVVESLTGRDVPVMGFADLGIVSDAATSAVTAGPLQTTIPTDVPLCDDCRREMDSPGNRRNGYGLITCAQCGPRYSVIRQMPFERENTTLAIFPLCDACQQEYGSITDRRYHAQTMACPECGPRVWVSDRQLKRVAWDRQAVKLAIQYLLQGQIVGLRGVGGYQLLCDATCQNAVNELRHRKGREQKPFAVLVADIERAQQLAELKSDEKEALTSLANPIVLVRSKISNRLCAAVHPGLRDVGLLLPTTGLHWQLAMGCDRPLICTSANLSGDPLLTEMSELKGEPAVLVDLWLHHDRPIAHGLDDSVVRVIGSHVVTIRAARGLTPMKLELPVSCRLLALGGHLKSALAWSSGDQAVLGAHRGDLDSMATRQRFVHDVDEVRRLYGFEPDRWLHDEHPDYFTTQWAGQRAVPTVAVPHHQAHVASGIIEHQLWDRALLGIAWDGAGYGNDETIWGGEAFEVNGERGPGMERVVRWRPFQLVGGDLAARQPWRSALSLLHQCLEPHEIMGPCELWFPDCPVASMLRILHRPNRSLWTTSVGRLFDGVAAICLGIVHGDEEGQAAQWLEACADQREERDYPVEWTRCENRPTLWEWDWRPMIRAIWYDRLSGVSAGTISQRFHQTLAVQLSRLAGLYPERPLVLSGGVFQNRLLGELVEERIPASRLYRCARIPPSDGGLAAGQLAWYALHSQLSSKTTHH